MKLLITKGFILPFDSGVIVIRDWKINNTLKNDRYHETLYHDEKSMLSLDGANRYCLGANMEPMWNQLGTNMEPEHNITKHNVTKQSEKADKPPRASRFTPPTVEEVASYCKERGNQIDPQHFVDFYSAKDWMLGKNKIKDWKACLRTWERRDGNKPDIRRPNDYYAEVEGSL